MKQARNKYVKLSLASMIVTATLSSVHHAYELGVYAVILIGLFIVLPAVFMQWFSKTGNQGSLWAYGLLNAWLVVGLGWVDGLWNHVVKPLGLQLHALAALHGGGANVVEKGVEGNFIYEGTAILTFVASIFAAYYGYKFIRTSRQSEGTSVHNTSSQ